MFLAAAGELISLEHLDASYNQLETFPNQIYQCPVKTLNLSHNQIIRMPGCSVTDPKQLRLQYITDLDVSYNKVRALLTHPRHSVPPLSRPSPSPLPQTPSRLSPSHAPSSRWRRSNESSTSSSASKRSAPGTSPTPYLTSAFASLNNATSSHRHPPIVHLCLRRAGTT